MGLYGGLEALSWHAILAMSQRMNQCPYVPQEDAWLRTCLQRLGVFAAEAYGAFCLRGCDIDMANVLQSKGQPAPEGMCPTHYGMCEGLHAAFHAYKTPWQYSQCHQKAAAAVA